MSFKAARIFFHLIYPLWYYYELERQKRHYFCDFFPQFLYCIYLFETFWAFICIEKLFKKNFFFVTVPFAYRGHQSLVLEKSIVHCGQIISGLRSLKQKIQTGLVKGIALTQEPTRKMGNSIKKNGGFLKKKFKNRYFFSTFFAAYKFEKKLFGLIVVDSCVRYMNKALCEIW